MFLVGRHFLRICDFPLRWVYGREECVGVVECMVNVCDIQMCIRDRNTPKGDYSGVITYSFRARLQEGEQSKINVVMGEGYNLSLIHICMTILLHR